MPDFHFRAAHAGKTPIQIHIFRRRIGGFMENVEVRTYPAERPVQWATGLKAAVAIGIIFWLITRGIPWATSGLVSPTVMGREIKSPEAIDFGAAGLASALHLLCAV